MDLETVPAEEFGRALTGIGVNLLSPNVRALAAFLQDVFGLPAYQLTDDFAIIRHGQMMMQLHSDGTYHSHPLLDFVPETPPRGGGLQLFLFGIDPDDAVARAEAAGHMVLEAPADKPHGLREGTILSPEGYAFSPAIPKA
jgi:predicted enzyme related to lactoylglutathione lyase